MIGARLLSVTDQTRCYLAAEEQILISSILRPFPEEFALHLEGRCSVEPRTHPRAQARRGRRRRRHLRRAPRRQAARLDLRRRLIRHAARMAHEERTAVGVIGGSGFYALEQVIDTVEIDTPGDRRPRRSRVAEIDGTGVAFLARHGTDHRLPPHRSTTEPTSGRCARWGALGRRVLRLRFARPDAAWQRRRPSDPTFSPTASGC